MPTTKTKTVRKKPAVKRTAKKKVAEVPEEEAPKRDRVRWTGEEHDFVAEAMWEHLTQNWGCLNADAYEFAMSLLPEDRRRDYYPSIVTPSGKIGKRLAEHARETQRVKEEIDSLKAQLHESVTRLEHERAKIRDLDSVLRELSDHAERNMALVMERITEILPLETILGQISLPKLTGVAAERLVACLTGAPVSVPAIRREPDEDDVVIDAIAPTVARKKPLLFIIGPKGDQVRELEQRLPNFEIRSVEDFESGEVPLNAVLSVCWARFCSHASYDRYMQRVPKERQLIVNGGLVTMVDRIYARLNEMVTR